MWRMIRIASLAAVGLCLVLALGGWAYVASLDLESEPRADRNADAADLPFLRARTSGQRGRILAVVTSTPLIGDSGRKAGYELTELSRAYWTFLANGYEVDIASPLGGEPPMRLDQDDTGDADYAFLNDARARHKLANSLPLSGVDPTLYQAVYFVGGKGAMFDFPGNPAIARIVAEIAPRGVVGAVCHGPAALIGLRDASGRPWLQGRWVTGFTNAEELFLIENARELFPYLLQDELSRQGARFVEGPVYLDNTVVDERLVTGQNPWSTWSVAEHMVRALGHEPVPRARSAEEISVQLLATYHEAGIEAALAMKAGAARSDRRLLLMHAVVAAMQWRLREAYQLQRLARN
ncbi:type 1 glutamine amidotransferase domain-containing protein [Marilutibacter aestuarii]|uniref:Type 1 glutamine amidotransferase domain-containing protein n=1 Tax=Marilutibacter aestuarii TaxID=1706195 RepID=A0A507ZZ26_9GAMM|nr:type 1 glutamine amidotransferase domain-containing protein [Lysobacter aestuarii]TQD42217.1 type 1 glutamine amidotransferase domain-containing protein [Lysobacter aestuarii]